MHRLQLGYVCWRAARMAVVAAVYSILFSAAYAAARLPGCSGLFEKAVRRHLPRLAERLGPAALKIGQIAGARPDLFPDYVVEPLCRLQDHVAPPPSRQIRRRVERAIAEPLGAIFASLDSIPLASGTVAVVLRGRTWQGADVVLKVVRPGIRRAIEADLAIIGRLAAAASKLRRFSAVPLTEIVSRFSALTRDQCSMRSEAAHHRQLSAYLGKDVATARLVAELSSDDVLAMSYVHAPRSLCSQEVPLEDYRRLCLVLLREVFAMIFVHGVVHGDLHPGNVRVGRGGTLVLFDFGLVAELGQIERRRLRQLFLGVVTGDARLVALSLLESSRVRRDGVDMAGLEAAVRDLLAVRTGQRAGEFLVAAFVMELFRIQNRFGLYGAPAFANAIWALAMYEGLVRDRFPQLDFQAEALKALMMPYANAPILERA